MPTRVAGNVYRLWGAYTPLFWVSVWDLNAITIGEHNLTYIHHITHTMHLPFKQTVIITQSWLCMKDILCSYPVLEPAESSLFLFFTVASVFTSEQFSLPPDSSPAFMLYQHTQT